VLEVIHLARYYQPAHLDTVLGEMDVHGVSFWTIERGWHNNLVRISCIPEGTYVLRRTMYYGGDGPGGRLDYDTFEIEGVVGRSHIKLHRANTSNELEGCVGLGNGVGWMRGRLAVQKSEEAHDHFMQVMQGVDTEQIRIYQAKGQT
jgi:hypothetical protein